MSNQDRDLYLKFYDNMVGLTKVKDNLLANGDVNWNFIDSDMYMKWSVLLDGATYMKWFDKAADTIEGVTCK